MARFRATEEVQVVKSSSNHPFQNIYGSAEGDFIYINMEAVTDLTKKMTTQRDMYLIVDMSGSMQEYYKRRGGLFTKQKPSEIQLMLSTIVDSIAPFDDDGVDVLFFANGLVHAENITSAAEVEAVIDRAMRRPNSFGTTMPLACFEAVVRQMREKQRPATVFFLTDGVMDDRGQALQRFYRTVLHEEFKTRDQFYCYAIEFGSAAQNALSVLDGLYPPEQGPEDLFDLESADNLVKITDVLRQVGAMSAIGSDDELTASVSAGAAIDMVNADLIEGGQQTIVGPINQIMSFRVRSKGPFQLTIKMSGYQDLILSCTPQGFNVHIQVA